MGEANLVVNGILGKKVYDTDKYVYKKYSNVDDLSDNQIKMDNSISSQVAHMAMPSDKYIDLTLGASGASYTAPADSWFYLEAHIPTKGYKIRLENSNPAAYKSQVRAINADEFCCCPMLPVKKGENTVVVYDGTLTNVRFIFIYAEGSK